MRSHPVTPVVRAVRRGLALVVAVALPIALFGAPAVAASPAVSPFASRATYSHSFTVDHVPDVVAARPDGGLVLYPGNGRGSFLSSYPQLGSGWQNRDMVRHAQDWDGDGARDVVARNPSDGSLWLYSGTGRGGFGGQRVIGNGWNAFSEIVAPGDFDGDGHPDLVTVRPDGVMNLYPGNGAGGFGSVYPQIGSGWQGRDAVTSVGDWDGDGRNDIVAREPATGRLWLYSGTGTGGFASQRVIGSGWGGFTALVGPGDFDGDGANDILARRADGDLYLYPGNARGGFANAYPRIGSGWAPLRIASAGAGAEPVRQPATFYLSPAGNDEADGRTTTTAWRSLARASRAVLTPGDRLFLQAGARFPGTLVLDSKDAGDATAPVVVGSYGKGRATIAASAGSGVLVYNTAGVQVRDVVIVGDAQSYRSKGGITFYSDGAGRPLDGVWLTRVEVSGFRNGVEIGSATAPGGFRNVRVTDSSLHDNMRTGLLAYGPTFQAGAPAYAHEAVSVEGVSAYRNVGDPLDMVRNSGSGIVLGSVRGGRIRHSRAYENGSACKAPEGPVGIWTYDSTRVVIERNLSYHNRTAGPADGGGFDLDQNVSDSVLQHNLAYGNDGPGYLVYTAQQNTAHRGNVVRFNISQHDVRKNGWYGGITVIGDGPVRSTSIHHNTVVSAANGSVRPAPLKVAGSVHGITVRNNIFVSDRTGRVVDSPQTYAPSAVTLQGNAYHAVGTWAVRWGATSASLDGWRHATGQEQLGGTATGTSGDPGLVDAYTPVTVTDPAALRTVTGFRLAPASPLIGRGLDLSSLSGTALASHDYFGTPLSPTTGIREVGAHQLAR